MRYGVRSVPQLIKTTIPAAPSATGVSFYAHFKVFRLSDFFKGFLKFSRRKVLSVAVFVIKNIVILLLSAIQFAMLARAILSWFPMFENKFVDFLYAITEPFINPIRQLFVKMNWFQGLPIDISFLVTFMLISLVSQILILF